MWLKRVALIANCRSYYTFPINWKSKFAPIASKSNLLNNFEIHAYGVNELTMRLKYVQHKGVKGIRSKKSYYEENSKSADDDEDDGGDDDGGQTNGNELLHLDDRAYEELAHNAMHITSGTSTQNVFVIQPYIKWGNERRSTLSTPDDQLAEAKALVDSLPNWHVANAIKIPLETLNRKALFGSGKMEELKQQIKELSSKQMLTCIFISKSTLSFAQKRILEDAFKLPVLDRYSVVIQILRLHATSAEARLQVAMAELPYIWAQVRDANPSLSRKQGYALTDTQREILKTREKKLKLELEKIREHRKLLRNKRKQKNYPVVAVVGYTNAGKTSLIKALTQEQSMQPRNQLFATLDVTAHAGVLPCNLEIIYMDTVGFMSDLPTGLIECFVATLEDAMLADIIIHVQDVSHRCREAQQQHVLTTLQSLQNNVAIAAADSQQTLPPIINVGNKADLLPTEHAQMQPPQADDIHYVSATQHQGLAALLKDIEQKILAVTGRRKLTLRVRNGGAELAWLHKNCAVTNVSADKASAEHLLMTVVISELQMTQFKRTFLAAK